MKDFKFKNKTKSNEENEFFDFGKGLSDKEFASFCKTPEAIKRIVLGRIHEVGYDPVYVDGAGQLWFKNDWIKRYGYDPEPVWQRMQKLNILKLGNKKYKFISL